MPHGFRRDRPPLAPDRHTQAKTTCITFQLALRLRCSSGNLSATCIEAPVIPWAGAVLLRRTAPARSAANPPYTRVLMHNEIVKEED